MLQKPCFPVCDLKSNFFKQLLHSKDIVLFNLQRMFLDVRVCMRVVLNVL